MPKAKSSALKVILFLILLTIAPRLYRINNPAADWHAFRQADTASVTREYVKNGSIDLLRPKYQDLSNIQSGKDNLEGWRMVEFPIINALVAFIVINLPFLDLVLVSRVVSIVFSIGSTVSLYLLVKRISGKNIAFFSAATFALLPFSVFYGRAILPEPAMLFFSTSSMLFFTKYLDQKNTLWSYLLSLSFLAMALLLKPFVAFLGPVYLTLAVQRFGKDIYKHPELILYAGLSFAPLIWWRKWVEQFPSGIPANDWLFNSNNIRFRPAWFRWLFYERLTKLFIGFFGWVFLLSNLIKYREKISELLVYLSWGVGLLLYLIVIATGNVQHDYYQIIMLPFVSILIGRGVWLFYRYWKKTIGTNSAQLATSMVFVLMMLFSWKYVNGYFNVNHWEYVEAGKIVDQNTPENAKVIAPAFGDTIFLFQTNRTGWPIGFEIADKIGKGATHYITTSYDDEARELETKYQTIVKNEKYLLLDLTKPIK